jgi:hypothetical protein
MRPTEAAFVTEGGERSGQEKDSQFLNHLLYLENCSVDSTLIN